ncbi:GntR family transcriptional regulator [Agrobacterium fabrum]|uniref:GntR family transcriptional regulator n=1 Tax=Agrobacterium fabrum TaxID=1176649 RepID=UPI003BA2E6AC
MGNQPDATVAGRADTIYNFIRHDILAGELLPGQRLDHRVLHRRFNVGTPLIREILQRLSAEKLVTHLPSKGYFVPPVNQTQLRDYYRWLRVILYEAIEKSVLDDGAKDEIVMPGLAEMPPVLNQQIAHQDHARICTNFAEALFLQIASALRSDVGIKLAQDLIDRTHLFRRLALEDSGYVTVEFTDLLALREAFLSREAAAAGFVLDRLLNRTQDRIPDLVMSVKEMCLEKGIVGFVQSSVGS